MSIISSELVNKINKLENDLKIFDDKFYRACKDMSMYIFKRYKIYFTPQIDKYSSRFMTALYYDDLTNSGYENTIKQYEEYLSTEFVMFIFNIYSHRRAICEDLVNKFQLIRHDKRDYRSTRFYFKIKRENFDAFCGLCSLMI